MSRIRSVKPELRTDLTVAEWPREVRYAWVLLLGYLDDHGRGRDDGRLIVADLFPLDRDVTVKKIGVWLDRMAKSGPLCRYEVDGRTFLHAVKWANHQRISHPLASQLPPCPVHDIHESDRQSSGTIPEDFRNDSGKDPEPFRSSRTPAEQGAGNEGAGSREQGNCLAAPPPDEVIPLRPRDELFDALVAACQIDAPSITASARGEINGVLKQLREVKADPGQIRVRAAKYRHRYPNTTLTPSALAKHWAAFTSTAQAERPLGWESG